MRAEIHAEVCRRAYDAERETFTQAYGSKELDASLLLIPAVGFPGAGRPAGARDGRGGRAGVSEGPLVHRYRTGDAPGADGLPGHEGAFVPCSFWLVDGLALIGRGEEARRRFDELLALRNDVGLLAEEYDAAAGRMVGNFPQAFSHVALVNSALGLARAGAAATGDEASPTGAPARGVG